MIKVTKLKGITLSPQLSWIFWYVNNENCTNAINHLWLDYKTLTNTITGKRWKCLICIIMSPNPSLSYLQEWLQKYGYLHHTEPGMSVLRSAKTMHSAIAAMQRIYGLNVTGTLDKMTKEWVHMTRAQTQAEQHRSQIK